MYLVYISKQKNHGRGPIHAYLDTDCNLDTIFVVLYLFLHRRLHSLHHPMVVMPDHQPAGLQVEFNQCSPGLKLFHQERVQSFRREQVHPLQGAEGVRGLG